MIFKGFKFGMLLQLAVGPVCIFIFQLAALHGFFVAETGVFGVVLMDGLYILLATLGIAAAIQRKSLRVGLKVFGALTLFIFGLSMILGLLGIQLIPSLNILNSFTPRNSFFHSLALTASNPLTIFFWAGVFSSKITEGNMRRRDVYAFGFGALMSTLLFLTFIAWVGGITQTFLPPKGIQVMNLIVGCTLIYFSLRMSGKK